MKTSRHKRWGTRQRGAGSLSIDFEPSDLKPKAEIKWLGDTKHKAQLKYNALLYIEKFLRLDPEWRQRSLFKQNLNLNKNKKWILAYRHYVLHNRSEGLTEIEYNLVDMALDKAQERGLINLAVVLSDILMASIRARSASDRVLHIAETQL
jgi:hypothetical protein